MIILIVHGVGNLLASICDFDLFQVAPYNTYYSDLEEHMTKVGIVPTISRWNESLELGAVDPHDSLSHPTSASDKKSESLSCVDPNQFTNFLVRSPFLLIYFSCNN